VLVGGVGWDVVEVVLLGAGRAVKDFFSVVCAVQARVELGPCGG